MTPYAKVSRVDKDTVKYFQEHGFPNLTEEQVEERYTPKISTDFIVEDAAECEYLKTKRIELDSILAVVGNEAFWNYIMYRLEELFPDGIDYTRVISAEPASPSNYYPESIKKFYSFIESHLDCHITSLFDEEEENIKSELDIAHKHRENDKRYRKIAQNDPRLKEIGAILDGVLTKAMEDIESKLLRESK